MQTNGKSPLALYIHIPFCSKKCHYCSFYTIPHREETVALYCDAIIQEGKRKLAPLQDLYHISTLFFGGGTPSLVPPSKLEEIISNLAPNAQEITLEANPENFSETYLHHLQQTGVNRISIGVQTFDDPLLRLLGRTHSSSQAIEALHLCKSYGFNNLSIDLIYGLPTQTLENFLCDLRQALTLPITHISLYNLTVDPHTSFYKHRETLASTFASDEVLATMSSSSEDLISSFGFQRYELASYAKPGFTSKHNLFYWTDLPFLGLGASASQYLQGRRSKNFSRISHYLRSIYRNLSTQEFSEALPEKEKIKEALALRLRLTEGALWEDFPKELWQALEKRETIRELFERDDLSLALNKRGRLFHDTVAEEIMNLSF